MPPLKAPQEHGAIIAEPPLTEAGRIVAANRQRLEQAPFPVLGRPSTDLLRQGREVVVAAAKEYLHQAGEPTADFGHTSILMAGHQPELFHPGVWVKNFALNGLAQTLRATPINLVVDQDTAKATALRMPVLSSAEDPWPHAVSLPYDYWSGEVPFEERMVNDEDLFGSLPKRAGPHLQDWGFVPLLDSFWLEVGKQAKRTRLLGERLVAARRTFERRWGCPNLELPVSHLCRTEPFAWFAGQLLAELPRFHGIYNGCVQAYRRRYGIRSRNHPVPDLAQEGEWLETPFWAWRTGQQQRGRLWARQFPTALALRVDAERWPDLPSAHHREAGAQGGAALVRAWQELEQRGFKIRSRALTNTLFARCFLADLFIHGIGGGKYDELTDEISQRFYGREPPQYLVLSATLLLPLPGFPARPELYRKLSSELRDLRYNPQRHLDRQSATSTALDLATEKQAWITKAPADKHSRREQFHVLRELTEKLRPFVASQFRTLQEQQQRCAQELQANAVLERRDYPFCLYPETMLRRFCSQFLAEETEPPAGGSDGRPARTMPRTGP
ncbi:MAG TPA: hypothetical protein VKU02_14340 [Gemmataceae bacterium]|nr:hypothetical protein [Gemmataceae bacterium]